MQKFQLVIIVGFGMALSLCAQAESLFDRYIQQNGGQIPFPYSNLRDMLLERANSNAMNLAGDNVDITQVLVPDGRSVQKNKANIRNPRVVTSINTPEGRIFIGYAREAGQMEVISWNQETQSYDFQIVNNYSSGQRPSVHTAQGQSCTQCHQHGGPIFTGVPWAESNNAELFRRMRRGPPRRTSYEGIEIPDPDAEGFDLNEFQAPIRMEADAQNGSVDLQRANICRTICGPDSTLSTPLNWQCRKSLLFLALNQNYQEGTPRTTEAINGNNDAQITRARLRYNALQMVTSRIQANMPANGFGYMSSILQEDRDPLADPSTYSDIQRRNQDPATPRWEVHERSVQDIESFLSQSNNDILRCLGMDSRETDAVSGYGDQALWNAIWEKDLMEVTTNMPINRGRLITALLQKLNPENVTSSFNDYCRNFTSTLETVPGLIMRPLERASAAAASTIYPGKDLFTKYCASCHGAESSNALPFDNLTQMQSYGRTPGRKIRSRLNRHFNTDTEGVMPPPDASPQPTDAERREMLQAIGP